MHKKSFLKDLRVKEPCSEDWNEMSGNEKVRFCSHCDLNVNNISEMSQNEALKVINKSNGHLCVRYIQHPKTKTPVFTKKLYQLTRQTGVAAGVLGATLAVNSTTYAQGQVEKLPDNPKPTSELLSLSTAKTNSKTTTGNGTISGIITDSTGAVIPSTVINLNAKNFSQTTTANNEGFYEFKSLPEKEYEITFNALQFNTHQLKGIKIDGANVSKTVNAKMQVSELALQLTGVIAVSFTIENPLVQAVNDGKLRKLKSLIAHGADVNEKDKEFFSRTALHTAVFNNRLKMTEILLNAGADVNILDENGNTPLMLIDEETSENIVKLLIKYGTNLDTREKESKRTALINAAMEDNFKAMKLLIEAGANVTFKDADGDSALDLTDEEKIRQLLIAYGAIEKD